MKKSISPYIGYKKTSDIHGTVLYPAVMVAPVQRDLLKEILPQEEELTICDPFVGSGTALYEAAKIRPRAKIIGSDINPLAILITRVKLEGVETESIVSDREEVVRFLTNSHTVLRLPDFFNIDKWFKFDVKLSLTWLSAAIGRVKSDANRRFLWYMMIDIVRRYCNSRSSTYKLHLRSDEQIERICDGVISDYITKIEEWRLFDDVHCSRCALYQGDSIEFLESLDANSVDVCITSPPYGDNATTVPYGQYSNLAMSWIDSEDLGLEGWELENYSSIDSRSLGGCEHPESSKVEVDLEDDVICEAIESICERKRYKVVRFMRGYKRFLDEMSRVTSFAAILTLGNRTVDGVNIDLAGYTERYLRGKGYDVEEYMRRPIMNKRTPSRVSSVNGEPVNSMKEERVLVVSYKKVSPEQSENLDSDSA